MTGVLAVSETPRLVSVSVEIYRHQDSDPLSTAASIPSSDSVIVVPSLPHTDIVRRHTPHHRRRGESHPRPTKMSMGKMGRPTSPPFHNLLHPATSPPSHVGDPPPFVFSLRLRSTTISLPPTSNSSAIDLNPTSPPPLTLPRP